MEHPILSVIIPCFNVENYISECLESLFNQDIQENSYEIICIDDCSHDKTVQIIIEYQKKHVNLILLSHVVNKKQGGARNTGLRAARGKYIWFVDSDDYIQSQTLDRLLSVCESNNLDLLQFNILRVSYSGKVLKRMGNVTNSVTLNGIDYVLSLESLSKIYDLSICSRIYRRKYLLDNYFVFPENILFEDLEFSLRTLLFADKFRSIDESVYFYRFNSDSTMNMAVKELTGSNLFQIYLFVGKKIIDLANEMILISPPIGQFLLEGGVWRINMFTKSLIHATYNEQCIFFNLIKLHKVNVVDKIYVHFNGINKFLISNQFIVKFVLLVMTPLIYIHSKIKQI